MILGSTVKLNKDDFVKLNYHEQLLSVTMNIKFFNEIVVILGGGIDSGRMNSIFTYS